MDRHQASAGSDGMCSPRPNETSQALQRDALMPPNTYTST
eukprot:CAMPEP_0197863964 /NCGR_PEP_ID=MMETSP1438-20131217/41800_1 /TAXON_ID=1461541 /ORGANISM="Pterosperma sp., Strain CCMP1384" /LENGTH=39 /DNA_ID= /DNA_START= /DNA_END= /DNA_ORIENTATION=